MIGGVTFKEDTHQYFDESGIEVPSVTQILKVAGLTGFGMEGTELHSDESMTRGKAAHQAIHFLEKGTLDESTVDEIVIPYVDAYKKFKKDTGYKPFKMECLLLHQQRRFAGTLDGIGHIENQPVLLEYKTGSYQPWHKLQVAGYRAALGDDFKTTKDYVLELKSNATYTLHKVAYEVTEELLFFSLVNLYYWRKNNNCLKTGKSNVS